MAGSSSSTTTTASLNAQSTRLFFFLGTSRLVSCLAFSILVAFSTGLPLLASAQQQAPIDRYDCRANRPSFPDFAFALQPDDHSVYLRVDALQDSSLTDAGLKNFCSVFGIRVVADADVSDEKLLHVAITLAELLDVDEEGKPTNIGLVEALRRRHSMIVLVSNSSLFRQLSRRTYRPKELKCFPRAFHVAHEAVIKPGERQELWCPEEEGKKDRTRGLVGDFLVSRGYPATYPTDREIGVRMTEFFETAKEKNWINAEASKCRSRSCLEIAFQSWALSSSLGSDKCWCLAAKEWHFCTPQDMKIGFPELWGTLAQELRNLDGEYDTKTTIQRIS